MVRGPGGRGEGSGSGGAVMRRDATRWGAEHWRQRPHYPSLPRWSGNGRPWRRGRCRTDRAWARRMAAAERRRLRDARARVEVA